MPCPRRLIVLALGLIALTLTARPATATWSADTTAGNPVSLVPGDVLEPQMVTDGEGGFIVMWVDFRKPGFDPDLYCTRVDANGDTLWASGGTVVCNATGVQLRQTIVSDGQGGAFMAWMDLRSGGSQGYYVQHIAANGVRRWAANGINPVGGFNSQFGPKLCPDGAGGVYLAFASGSPGTQLQRLDSLGVKKLGFFPPAEGPLLRGNPSAPLALVSDGSGGVVAAVGYGTASPVDIAAQRVSSTGVLQWVAGGVTVCAATGSQGNVALVPDGGGGGIFAWDDGRTTATDIYAQRISGAGAAQWAANGIAVCNADTIQSNVQLRPLADGGVVAAWRDYRHLPATSIYAQRVAGDGSIGWLSNGRRVCSSTLAMEIFTVAGGGGDSTIVVWNTIASNGGDVFAQKIDDAGTAQWGEYGATVCRGPNDQTNSASVSDGAGGVLVCYRDRRSANDANLYANRVGPNGALVGAPTVGVPWLMPVAHVGLRSAPNPASGRQTLTFGHPVGSGARVEVLDVMGRRCRSQALAQGALAWTWDGRDDSGAHVRAGIYHARLTEAGRAAIARIVRLD